MPTCRNAWQSFPPLERNCSCSLPPPGSGSGSGFWLLAYLCSKPPSNHTNQLLLPLQPPPADHPPSSPSVLASSIDLPSNLLEFFVYSFAQITWLVLTWSKFGVALPRYDSSARLVWFFPVCPSSRLETIAPSP